MGVDVAGWCADENICGNHRVLVEVSRTSDLSKDIGKLYDINSRHNEYDILVVVPLKEYMPAGIGMAYNVYIVKPDVFEDLIRSTISVPSYYPRYSGRLSIDKYLSQTPKRVSLEELLKDYGIEEMREDIERFLLGLSAHEEVPVSMVYCHPHSSDCSTKWYTNSKIADILEQLGIITISSRGTYYPGKLFYARPTPKGETLIRLVDKEFVAKNWDGMR